MMPRDVIMPALGMAQETGTLLRWLKAEGDQVRQGEPLAEIMTDKATVELEAPAGGILVQVTAAEGAEVPVGHSIATVLLAGETAPAAPTPTSISARPDANNAMRDTDGAVAATPVAAAPPPALAAATHATPAAIATSSRHPASPKARRLAQARGLSLTSVRGTGPNGAVLAADVLAAASATPSPVPSTFEQVDTPALALNATWRIMAERTTHSWQATPHFFVTREVNASQLVAWRDQMRRRTPDHVTYSDLLVKLTATILQAHPRLNASWHDGAIETHSDINIGLAIATEDGLVAPVLHRADSLSLNAIAQRRAELVQRAQVGKLKPEDVTGGTFTLSNLGMYDIDTFSAIIVPPQAAILAVGRIADRVVPVRGVPAVQPMLTLTLSCDHRVVDGARAARFLGALAGVIETPLALLE